LEAAVLEIFRGDMCEAKPGDVLAECSDYRSMKEAIRAWRNSTPITFDELDEKAGLPRGYTSKLLAPEASKNLGRISLGPVLQSLGLKLLIVVDKIPKAINPRKLGAAGGYASRRGKTRKAA
jgi:hypothetical protein